MRAARRLCAARALLLPARRAALLLLRACARLVPADAVCAAPRARATGWSLVELLLVPLAG